MKFTIAFLWTLLRLFGVESILDGSRVKNITQMPWNVFISVMTTYSKEVGCSGSIIDSSHVLTASSCLCPGNMRSIEVFTGVVNASHTKHKYPVEAYGIHPNIPQNRCFSKKYNPKHDVAVLKTKAKIRLSKSVKPIGIRFEAIQDNLPSLTMGYGCDEEGQKGSLNYADVESKKCKYRQVEMICTSPGYKIECSGDSGGPLVTCSDDLKNCQQIGIITNYWNGNEVVHVSTHVEKLFIRNALANKDLKQLLKKGMKEKLTTIPPPTDLDRKVGKSVGKSESRKVGKSQIGNGKQNKLRKQTPPPFSRIRNNADRNCAVRVIFFIFGQSFLTMRFVLG